MTNLEKYTKTETNSYWLRPKASDQLIRKHGHSAKQSKFITSRASIKLCKRANCYILQQQEIFHAELPINTFNINI